MNNTSSGEKQAKSSGLESEGEGLENEGEGNRTAARRYNDMTRRFMAGKAGEAALDAEKSAPPKSR